MKNIIFLLFFVFLTNVNSQNPLLTSDHSDQVKWVDSVYNSLSIDEKIGQLFTVWVATKYGDDEINEISKLIENYHLGGLIFSLGNIKDQALAINHFQKIQKLSLK